MTFPDARALSVFAPLRGRRVRRLLSLFLPLFPLSDGRIPLFPVMPIVVAFLRNYSSRASHFCHRRSGNITAAVAKIIFGPSLSVRPKEEMMQWREKRGGKEQEGKKSIRLQITLASPLLHLLLLLLSFLHDLPTFSHLIANCFSGMDAAAAATASVEITFSHSAAARPAAASAIPPLQFE